MNSAVYPGLFLVSFSLFFLQILCSRVFASVIGPEAVLTSIAVAMLGLGMAGSVSSITRRIEDSKLLGRRAAYACGGAALSNLLLFLLSARLQASLNAVLDVQPHAVSGFKFFQSALHLNLLSACVISLWMGASFFFHGFVLAQIFRNAGRDRLHLFYAADLLGAFAGIVTAIVSLEAGGFEIPAAVALGSPLLAAAAFLNLDPRKSRGLSVAVFALAVAALISMPVISSRLEPQPSLRAMARLASMYTNHTARELGHWWTSYGRIAAMEIANPQGESQALMVHGMGDGHARIIPFPSPPQVSPVRILHATELSLSACKADRVLVLLAGPGTEMVLVDQLTQGRAAITGVEMISKVVEWPVNQPRFGLKNFFSNPKNRIVVAEAREFLARDKTRYDCILVSWSGASRSYYTGTMATAPDHLYTREGLEELLRHLTPGGQLTLINANKVRLMLTAMEIFHGQGEPSAADRFVVVGNQSPWSIRGGPGLLLKPDGFTREDILKIGELTRRAHWELLYHPFMQEGAKDESSFWVHAIRAKNSKDFVDPIARALGVRVEPSTDDKPFVFNLLPSTAVFQGWFWGAGDPTGPPGRVIRSEEHRAASKAARLNLLVMMTFLVASLVMILGPFASGLWNPSKDQGHFWRSAAYFGSLGAGFMWIEMGMIQKFRLLIGHPGYTLGTVLGSIVLFAGLGSLASGTLFRRNHFNLPRVAWFSMVAAILCVGIFEVFSPAMLGFPREAKLAIAFLLPALPAFFMGQLYPQGLISLTGSDQEIPLFMAINACTGTIASGLGVTLAQTVGYSGVIYCGAGLYLVAGLLARGAAHPQAVRNLSS